MKQLLYSFIIDALRSLVESFFTALGEGLAEMLIQALINLFS